MAVSGAAQALIAAFSFGILFNAASATLVLYVKGHGSAIFRDGPRLVLILFLLSSTSWAVTEFLETLIDSTAVSTCQVAVIFSSLFDQLGRTFVEQYLVWGVQKGAPLTAFNVMPQILVLGRLIAGIAFVATTKPDFAPTCVPTSNISAVPIAVIATDAVILVLLAIQAFSPEPAKGAPRQQSASGKGKAVSLVVIGVAVWMGTSVPLLLGISTLDLFLRTTLSVIGLTILVALITIFSQTLVISRRPPKRPDSPTAQGMSGSRDLSSSDTVDYPPSRYEDVKEVNTMTLAAFAQMRDAGGLPAGMVDGMGFPIIPHPSEDAEGKHKRPQMPKMKGGKITISHPMINENGDTPNPLSRMPTVDLATAANNEKERRETHARRVSALIAQRPAPRPPVPPNASAATNVDASLKRKEAPDLDRSASTKTAQSSEGLSVDGNASSSGTQLSPGADALRRRSPRQQKPAPTASAIQAIRPGEPIRIPIPRPPEPPKAPPAEVPEPVKTPLQRRATTGLPSNPRAHAMKAAREAASQKEQTVMFVNSITYDDPGVVDSIVQGASKTPYTPMESGNSVLHRPRPIPRSSDHDRLVFPAEASPNRAHRRSKSGGSIISRKSILQSMPGSPTQLPSLPPLPITAGTEARPLPNNTKSMTFDEKMNFLYEPPLSAPSTTDAASKRQTEIPAMPPVPSAYIEQESRSLEEDSRSRSRASRASKTTDRSSLRTASILGVTDVPDLPQRITQDGALASETHRAVDELGNSWLPGIPPITGRDGRASDYDAKRKSSPVLPISNGRPLSMSTVRSYETRSRDDASTTHWGSVHSPVVPVNVQAARQKVRSTYIRNDSLGNPNGPVEPAKEEKEQVMTIMLDTSSEHSFDNRKSFYLEDDELSVYETPVSGARESSQFHHKIGDECPTFSTRKEKGCSRKIPPTPLLLNGRSTKRAIVVQPAEPSPVESPAAAYQVIQEQLQRFDQTSRASVQNEEQRLALLEDLEREMGELENHWQSTQTRLERDSVSSIQTASTRESRPNSLAHTLSRTASQHSIAAERRASRQARMRSRSRGRSQEDEGRGTPSSQASTQSSESAQASSWQTRLAEAQMAYMENAPDLIMKRNNLNFLSVSKAALGSPSPPDTDESEAEADVRKSLGMVSAKKFKPAVPVSYLWAHSPAAQQPSTSGLWAALVRVPERRDLFKESSEITARPSTKKFFDQLAIESEQLWQRPIAPSKSNKVKALWEKHVAEPIVAAKQVAPRPTTIRPPRRNKRVTLLPDIIENPEPLPNQRETLGIFQFPWGEKSEHATIQYRQPQMFMAMPGTMTSGRPTINPALDARSRQLESSEYSSSFFDEYDEEEGDNFDDYEDSDDDGDDFDETTLWEIASLLKSEIPSKDSLLPAPLQASRSVGSSVLAEYVADIPSDHEDEEEPRESEIMTEEPVPVEALAVASWRPSPVRPLLWTAASDHAKTTETHGLPQPSDATWASYVPEIVAMARPRPRLEEPMPVNSDSLWTSAEPQGDSDANTPMWSAPKRLTSTLEPVTVKQPIQGSLMWVPLSTASNAQNFGLPQPSETTWSGYMPEINEMARPRPRPQEPLSIDSGSLWTIKTPRVGSVANAPMWSGTSRVVSPPVLVATKQPIQSSLMWAPLSQVSSVKSFGLPQPDEATWTASIPDAGNLTKSQPRSREGLPTLGSFKLWEMELSSKNQAKSALLWTSKSPIQSSEASVQLPLLWSRAEVPRVTYVDGMFDVRSTRLDYRRTSKDPAALELSVRPFRANDVPLPQLTSTSLWEADTLVPVDIPAPSEEAVRSSINKEEAIIGTAIESHGASANDQSVNLWERSMTVVEPEYNGLFDVQIPRQNFRTTHKLPAALSMTTKPRTSREPTPSLTSSKLWVIEFSQETKSRARGQALWTKHISQPLGPRGLFQVDSQRTTYRTTTAEPAALEVLRRPRVSEEPVQKLESTRLWVNGQTRSVEVDWMTVSSVRPTSPSAASISTVSSSPSSPVTDAASVKTNMTKASTVTTESKSKGSFFSGWFGKKSKKEPEVPKVPEQYEAVSKAPVAEEPELPEEFVVKNLDEAPHEKPVHIALRQQHLPMLVYSGNWDAALTEAIVASYPGTMLALRATYPQDWETQLCAAVTASHIAPKITRRSASPREWCVALRQAITESYPELRFSRGQTHPGQWERELKDAMAKSQASRAKPSSSNLDVSVRHPVFFGTLASMAQTVHPALTGYRVEAKHVEPDVSVRHPVFFGSRVPSSGDVHPAMSGYTSAVTSTSAKQESARFNAAVRHPVFFGSLTTTCAVVHPAMHGYASATSANSAAHGQSSKAPLTLWVKPIPAPAVMAKAMWTLPSEASSVEAPSLPFVNDDMASVQPRKTSVPAEKDVDVDFGEEGMWKRHSIKSDGKNWLDVSMKKKFNRIELRY
ncbi:hypothetical protein F5Y15DRAFT_273891 [Xylariaceae sp. FL0016]|nr:hypothetical protein F5Y15DRAFT_273891 [Xylariaceae sp. FL0016]